MISFNRGQGAIWRHDVRQGRQWRGGDFKGFAASWLEKTNRLADRRRHPLEFAGARPQG
jgi:hypothetical protein